LPTIFDADLTKLLQPQGGAGGVGAGKNGPAGTPAPANLKSPAGGPQPGTIFPFVSLDVRHGFANGAGEVFGRISVRPTRETRRRLALFGLIPRPRPDGIDIFWDTTHRDQASSRLDTLRPLVMGLPEGKHAEAIDKIGQIFGEPLLFTVAIEDPHFASFTDMPIDLRIGDPPLLLSNWKVEQKVDSAADLVIPWPSDPVQAAAPPKPVMEKVAIGYYEALAAKEKALPARPHPVVQEEAAKPEPAPEFRGAADVAAGAERRQLMRKSTCFALLELYFTPEPGTKGPASGWNGLPVDLARGLGSPPARGAWRYFTPCTYTLRFAPRATRWRYVVAARSGALDPTSLAIVDADGADAGFALAEAPYILPGGQAAACLSSRFALPVLAQPAETFALVGASPAGGARRRTLVQRLPAASAQSLSLGPPATSAMPPPRSAKPPPLYSDIYVFV
jgi:hypothetical protein